MSNDPTNAERQARHRAKLRQERAALEAEVAALRGELARERKRREAAEAKISKPPRTRKGRRAA